MQKPKISYHPVYKVTQAQNSKPLSYKASKDYLFKLLLNMQSIQDKNAQNGDLISNKR